MLGPLQVRDLIKPCYNEYLTWLEYHHLSNIHEDESHSYTLHNLDLQLESADLDSIHAPDIDIRIPLDQDPWLD